eukprot:scaffold1498_cov180-Ochromonas_danica.AAC.14
MGDTSYDKQWRWKKAALRKAEKLRARAEEHESSTFEPRLYTSNFQGYRDHGGGIPEAVVGGNNGSGGGLSKPYNKQSGGGGGYMTNSSPPPLIGGQGISSTLPNNGLESSLPHSSTATKGMLPMSQLEEYGDDEDLSSSSDSDEPIVELLERERRQWQAEREKLIQCIHLQQLELAQRNLAAQERAVDIAKDFTKVIESFEERLVNIESHVQREMNSLKAIAESLLAALGKTNANASGNNMML